MIWNFCLSANIHQAIVLWAVSSDDDDDVGLYENDGNAPKLITYFVEIRDD